MASVIREQEIQLHPRASEVVATINVASLEAQLRARVQGEVRFDAGSRALYATDAANYRYPPIGVITPKHTEDVVQTISACRQHGAPLVSRGGGTSLAGQTCNVAVVMDFSKYMHQIVELDPERKLARVQPGLCLDDLRDAAEQHHLTFGPDPSTHQWCTIGGMIGNNACGVHSVMSGKTVDNIEELEILTYDGLRMRVGPTSEAELERIIRDGGRRGEIYAGLKSLRDRYAPLIRERYPQIPRLVSGYNLDQLLPEKGFHVARALVGTEGTCVTILEATARLVHSPPGRKLVVLGYPNIYQAADHVPDILPHQPVGLEGMDDKLVSFMELKGLHANKLHLLPDGGGWLLVEFGGESEEEAHTQAQRMIEQLERTQHPPSTKFIDDPEEAEEIWIIRESGLAATAFVPGMQDTWPGWEDSAVAPDRLGDYLRGLRELLDQHGYECALYGHFGDGCVHCRIDFELETSEGIQRYRQFIDEAADLVVGHGGTLSGEHGDGQARSALLPKMYGDELMQAFREFKTIWDPQGKMNPGNIVDPYQPDENLRLGTEYRPAQVNTYFKFPEDNGSFANATLRCVGVGKCRRTEGGTMCPSYMVTHEEKHTTRGRAHLLFEMLRGEIVTDGWHDENVKESLDLCLACKGCKNDCPVNVDMATYKAEFLAHYYEGRLRPRSALAFGLIFYWARLAALLPQVANFFTQTPLLRDVAKLAADVAPERQIPAFAPQTFKAWFRQRGMRNADKERVILWPDTFNNHFHPQIPQAAVEVLEDAGYQVVVPEEWMCCGRPVYDFGMLNLAQRLLQNILDTLRPEIAAGTPIVGLEPSCVSVLRDELLNLFPHDKDARRLSVQTYTLGEFLKKQDYQPPQLQRQALVHGHCHHKAIMHLDGEHALLKKMGLDFGVLDAGCCGMAGAFGFERGEKYEVSIKCGERVLLPRVREAATDMLIIADGFSCQEQIAQTTDRRALHTAQILQMALQHGAAGPVGMHPETRYATLDIAGSPNRKLQVAAVVGGGVVAAGAAIAWMWKKRKEHAQ